MKHKELVPGRTYLLPVVFKGLGTEGNVGFFTSQGFWLQKEEVASLLPQAPAELLPAPAQKHFADPTDNELVDMAARLCLATPAGQGLIDDFLTWHLNARNLAREQLEKSKQQ